MIDIPVGSFIFVPVTQWKDVMRDHIYQMRRVTNQPLVRPYLRMGRAVDLGLDYGYIREVVDMPTLKDVAYMPMLKVVNSWLDVLSYRQEDLVTFIEDNVGWVPNCHVWVNGYEVHVWYINEGITDQPSISEAMDKLDHNNAFVITRLLNITGLSKKFYNTIPWSRQKPTWIGTPDKLIRNLNKVGGEITAKATKKRRRG